MRQSRFTVDLFSYWLSLCKKMFEVNKKRIIILKLIQQITFYLSIVAEATTGDVLKKKVFLKISQYSQENICVGISF